MKDIEEIVEYAHVNGLRVLEGFNEAVIGIEYADDKLVYSSGRIIQILIDEHGMNHDEAVEYFEFNIVGYLNRDFILVWQV